MAVDLAQKAQNFTNRGRQALETGRYELAVDMLMEAVSAAPDILETRKLLRAAQIANFKKNGKVGFGAKLGYMMARQKILGLVKKGKGVEAMAEAEKLLCQNPLDADNIEAAVKPQGRQSMPPFPLRRPTNAPTRIRRFWSVSPPITRWRSAGTRSVTPIRSFRR